MFVSGQATSYDTFCHTAKRRREIRRREGEGREGGNDGSGGDESVERKSKHKEKIKVMTEENLRE